ncbi:hypothetical protein V6N12_005805 [Hibiscus sabdariffa]|uniref:Uncharacterized protein n=1 Tax=Hibiscus sabdariffa TaxID=183260 RepID=A0ABR2AWQ4_9ROSI
MAADGRVYISRHVVFDEAFFPYTNLQSGSLSVEGNAHHTVTRAALPVVPGAARVCGRLQQREGCVVFYQDPLVQPACSIRDEVSPIQSEANVDDVVPNADDVNTNAINEAVSPTARDSTSNVAPSLSIHDNLVSAPVNNPNSSENADLCSESVIQESQIEVFEQPSHRSVASVDPVVGGIEYDQGAPAMPQEVQQAKDRLVAPCE